MKRRPFILLFALIFSACQGSTDFPKGHIIFESKRYNHQRVFYLVDINNLKVSTLPIDSEPNYDPSYSPDGEYIVYASGSPFGLNFGVGNEGKIYSMRVDGSDHRLLFSTLNVPRNPVFSPDGSKIAFSVFDLTEGNQDIYIMGSDGSNPINITNHPSSNYSPAWSPDGTKIAFTSIRDGNKEIYIMNTDGSGQVNVSRHPQNDSQPSWSPDGKYLVFTSRRDDPVDPPLAAGPIFAEQGYSVNLEIYIMSVDGSGQENISNHPSNDSQPVWSPNGRMIAFVSYRDGNQEIYIMDIDGSNQINITNSQFDDFSPAWRPE
ncbi:MAG: hypothetical protein FVQ83_02655 [Chloroflexi bacterium]|nr:hypothetical protein [Chloroflexota bacterium]